MTCQKVPQTFAINRMVETPPLRTASDRRSAILEAARAEFDARGFAGSRVQRVADVAGVNKQLIFHYHGSKLGLFRDVVAGSLAEIERMVADEGGPATKRIRQQIAGLYEALAERPHIGRLLTSDARLDHVTDELVGKALAAFRARFASVVTDGQRVGYFRDDSDAEVAAGHAVSLVVGHLMLDQTSPEPRAKRSQPDVADSICRLVLRSLEW